MRFQKCFSLWLTGTIIAASALIAMPAKAVTPELITSVTVGNSPAELAVNSATHKIYVPNTSDDTVSVIDGLTNTVVKTIPVGDYPDYVSINESTNRIYVSNSNSSSVSVIDGTTDTVLTTITGLYTYAKKSGVNSVTNRLYVPTVNKIYVINTQTNAVVKTIRENEMGDGYYNPVPDSATVNETTNTYYVVLLGVGSQGQNPAIAKFDGVTNEQIGLKLLSSFPRECKINPVTNRLYVVTDDGNLTMLDGTTLDILGQVRIKGSGGTDTAAGHLVLDPVRNQVYTSNNDPTFSIFDGSTLQQIGTGSTQRLSGIAFDKKFGRTYISNLEFKKVSVFKTVPDAPPVANDDSATVAEDSGQTAIGVLNNDSDTNGDTLSITYSSAPAYGTTRGTINGVVSATGPWNGLTYQPDANFHGTDTFTYSISDGKDTATATVTITVTPINDAPDAASDTFTVSEDSGAMTLDVLDNDGDIDGDSLTITSATDPAHGTTVVSNGILSYSPDANFHGTDSFQYSISDGKGGSDTATVTMTVTPVNDNPDAADDNTEVQMNSDAININVLANDSDVDADTLTITEASSPAHGTITLTGPVGAYTGVTYTPTANYSGADSFSYTISDGQGGTDTANVTITVTAPNNAPVANAGSDQTITATGLTTDVTLSGSASSDPDGDTLTYSWSEGATVLAAGANPTVKLAPGVHNIVLTVSDGKGGSATDSVTITVEGSTPRASVTGHGMITAPGGKQGYFAVFASVTTKKTVAGGVFFVDARSGVTLESTQLTALYVSGNSAKLHGIGKVNGLKGQEFVISLVDVVRNRGNFLLADHFNLEIKGPAKGKYSGSYSTGSALRMGDITIR